MHCRILTLIFCLFATFYLGAQCRDVTLSEDGGTASGKVCKRKIKSTYSGKTEMDVRTGTWTFMNEDGVLFKKGDYVEMDGGSVKSGTWQWFGEDGKCFLKLEFSNDKPVKIQALDSGIAIFGDDSACVYMPDTLHYIIRFSMKGQHKGWKVDAIGNWLDYNSKTVPKKPYKAAIGVIGKNEETDDEKGYDAEKKENIRWTDEEMLEMFVPLKQFATTPMALVQQELNLIKNPSFLNKGKPVKQGTYILNSTFVDNWSASEETPDVFSGGGPTALGFRVSGGNYEVIRGALSRPLTEGVYYCFSVQIKLRHTNVFAVNNLGALVSAEPSYTSDKSAIPENVSGTFLLSPIETPLCLRDTWMTIEGRFKAKGGEKYIYFGYFSTRENARTWPLDSIFNGNYTAEIYYFIQNPVLIEAPNSDMCICNLQDCPEEEKNEMEEEKPALEVDSFVLTNVQFETNKWELLESAYDALDSLADYLNEHETYTVEITGHTDNMGKPKDNQELSEKRAKAVLKYLEGKGISAKRMKYYGKGDSDPIDENDSEEGREHNRRVEFKVTKLPD